MCTILFGINQHPDYKLVLLANRDEFYARPTAPAAMWEDDSGILGGRDLQDGGTWMGITESGRFAAITNYREAGKEKLNAPSRGHLVSDYLKGDFDPTAYFDFLKNKGAEYNGFNLLFGNADELHYFGNQGGEQVKIPNGVHGLSNHLLNTNWPKVDKGKNELSKLLNAETTPEPQKLMGILENKNVWPDDQLPKTGVSLEWERLLSATFIESEKYGTRSSSIVMIDRNNHVTFHEKVHEDQSERTYGFDIA